MLMTIADEYACPSCHAHPLETNDGGIWCPGCKSAFSTVNALWDLMWPRSTETGSTRFRVYWDELAKRYDELLDRMLGKAEVVFKERLIRLLGLRDGATVLEVGIGTGRNLPIFDRMGGPGLTLYGIDLSPEMLDVCSGRAKQLRGSVRLAVANAEHLPFRDDSFDAVLHFGFINDFADPRQALAEMTRVVKPGGRVVVSDDGFPEGAADSAMARELIPKNPAFGSAPPVGLLPASVEVCHVSWFMGVFYVLAFRKKDSISSGEMALAPGCL
jgi:ubiquinone/menaquinone biosynthesis C-methylase UbiE